MEMKARAIFEIDGEYYVLQEDYDELEKEIDELKRCWGIEIETCNRYRGKCEKLEEENKKLKEELSKYKGQYEHSLDGDDELIYEEGLYD